MKVSVNKEKCIGCETCVAICPEIFSMAGDLAIAKVNIVPDELKSSCQDAANGCPVEAIEIE